MAQIIDNTAIKIAGYQIIPGSEPDVALSLGEACTHPDVRDSLVLKCFGAFDVILIYAVPHFNFKLSQNIKSNDVLSKIVFYAFSYDNSDINSIFTKLRSHPFVGISFLKVDPALLARDRGVLHRIEDKLKRTGSFLLGSVGWSEIVLISGANELRSLSDFLYKISRSKDKATNRYFFSQVYTTLTMHYRFLPSKTTLRRGTEFTKSHLDAQHATFRNPVGTLYPMVRIAAEPKFESQIVKYWENNGFYARESVGREDIVVHPVKRDAMSWSHFFSALLCFRSKFAGKIHSTNTSIQRPLFAAKYPREFYRADPYVPEDFPKLHELTKLIRFDPSLALRLATEFRSLTGLLKDQFIATAFNDMVLYPKFIAQSIKALNYKRGIDKSRIPTYFRQIKDYVIMSSTLLRQAMELRCLGTFRHFQYPQVHVSYTKGGVQRALLAMEYIPFHILSRFKKTWNGFITVGEYKFANHREIIIAPPSSLFDLKSWWALYHETSHILLQRQEFSFYPAKIPATKPLLVDNPNPAASISFLEEVCAEILCYELGFFEDHHLYSSMFWKHIRDIQPTHPTPVLHYLQRSFAVRLYNDLYITKRVKPKIFTNDTQMYSLFLDHIRDSGISDLLAGRDKFIAAEYSNRFGLIYPFLDSFRNKIKKYRVGGNARRKKSVINSHNTLSVFESISNGKVWNKDIKDPLAVLYHLFLTKEVSVQTTVAAILTFHNKAYDVYGL